MPSAGVGVFGLFSFQLSSTYNHKQLMVSQITVLEISTLCKTKAYPDPTPNSLTYAHHQSNLFCLCSILAPVQAVNNRKMLEKTRQILTGKSTSIPTKAAPPAPKSRPSTDTTFSTFDNPRDSEGCKLQAPVYDILPSTGGRCRKAMLGLCEGC